MVIASLQHALEVGTMKTAMWTDMGLKECTVDWSWLDVVVRDSAARSRAANYM